MIAWPRRLRIGYGQLVGAPVNNCNGPARRDKDLHGTVAGVIGKDGRHSHVVGKSGTKIVDSDMAPGFMIKLLNKDLRLTMELAQQAQLPLPALALAQQEFISAQAKGHGQLGTQALSKIIEGLGHFKIRD